MEVRTPIWITKGGSFLSDKELIGMSKLTQSPAWQALEENYKVTLPLQMRDLFAQDADRFEKFSLRWQRHSVGFF